MESHTHEDVLLERDQKYLYAIFGDCSNLGLKKADATLIATVLDTLDHSRSIEPDYSIFEMLRARFAGSSLYDIRQEFNVTASVAGGIFSRVKSRITANTSKLDAKQSLIEAMSTTYHIPVRAEQAALFEIFTNRPDNKTIFEPTPPSVSARAYIDDYDAILRVQVSNGVLPWEAAQNCLDLDAFDLVMAPAKIGKKVCEKCIVKVECGAAGERIW